MGVTPGPVWTTGRLTAGTAGAPARCRTGATRPGSGMIGTTGHLTGYGSTGGRGRGISGAAVGARTLRRAARAAGTERWRRVHGSAAGTGTGRGTAASGTG
jgi:hypothetical protein